MQIVYMRYMYLFIVASFTVLSQGKSHLNYRAQYYNYNYNHGTVIYMYQEFIRNE